LQENGDVMGLSEALQIWRCGDIGDRTIFAITVDDGLKSSQFIIDKLHEIGVNPTLFLNAKPLFNPEIVLHNHLHLQTHLDHAGVCDKYFSTDDIKKLLTDSVGGIELGSHTFNHINLSDVTFNEARFEIVECHRAVEKLVGAQIPYFGFPYGKLDARNYFSDSAARSLNVTIFECYGGINNVYRKPYNLLRIGIHNESKNEFAKLLSRQWIR
jgi:peptidoglycan/xylan/chitin deacetylase (PgdA/CDA1 family)